MPLTPAAAPAGVTISFKHPGRTGERCRDVPADELAKLPPHMRQPRVCERGRAAVRLRVTVDGALALDEEHPPRGLFGDGNAVAVRELALPPGEHHVRVELDGFSDERTVVARDGELRVVTFDRTHGFRWR
jgi:hypothetical protein